MRQFFDGETASGNQVALFSQMPENRKKQAAIKAIAGPGVNFATDFLAGEPESGTTTATRHQAEYDPKRKTWHLVVLNRYHGGAFDNLFKRDTVARTENIFDALHWCSSFQAASERKLGKHVVDPGEEYSHSFEDWRDVARNMNLPIAENGVLLLPEDGRILPDGYYSGDQIAAHKAPRHLPAVSTASAPISSTTDAVSLYQEVIAKGTALESGLSIMWGNRYMNDRDALGSNGFFAHFASGVVGLTVSVIPNVLFNMPLLLIAGAALPSAVAETIRYAKGDPKTFPVRCFEKRCAAFNKAAARLPDPDDRALCREFAKQAAFTFWSGRAQTIYERKTKAGQSAKAGLSCLDKAIAAIGLDDAGRESLRNSYMAAGFGRQPEDRLKGAGQSYLPWDTVKNRLQNVALKLGGAA